MMVLGIRDMRERIDEAHGAIEILEFERALQAFRVRGELPIAVQLFAKRGGLSLVQGEPRRLRRARIFGRASSVTAAFLL